MTTATATTLQALYGVTPAPALSDRALATVTSKQGTTTMSLPVRRDPDCPRRLQIQTPCKCRSWEVLFWHEYAGIYEPVHCTGCVIGLYDIQPAPAVVETEPAAVEVAEPVASIETSAPAVDEQDALIAELAFEADAEIDRERHVAIRSGKYVLWCRCDSMMAVDCSCPSRVKRNRLAGKACKHQMSHNATLQPAKQQEAA